MAPVIGVVGLPVVDLVAHIPLFPQSGGHVSGTSLTAVPGGPACNFATAVSRLGGHARLVGIVGDDVFGRLLQESLREENIDISGLDVSFDLGTVGVLVLFEADGQGEQRSFSFGLNENLERDMLANEQGGLSALTDLDALFLDGILAFSDTWTASGLAATRYAKQRSNRTLVVCDPNIRIPDNKLPEDLTNRISALFSVSDIVLVNEHESRLITNIDDPEKSATYLMDKFKNLSIVVVKLGAEGALLLARGERTLEPSIFIPPFAVEVVDTSGAGDSFGAAFTVALLEGHSLVEAGRLASASGALATTKKGAWLGIPNREDRDRLVAKAGEG